LALIASLMNTFDGLGLAAPLLKSVQAAGYTEPTPIQLQSIPHLLQGSDLLGCAKTGTGKTAAFALPIIQRLMAHQSRPAPKYPRALVLVPTRELAAQVGESFRTYSAGISLASTVIYGGVGQKPQVAALQRGVDVLVATPGRLVDLIGQGFVRLDKVEVLVLDEADHMLDLGFIPDVRTIVAKLPQKRQTLFFSATMPPEIAKLAESMLHKPVKVYVAPPASTVDAITQSVYFVNRNGKPDLLVRLLSGEDIERALVFTRTKRGADKVARKLNQAGISAHAIHGNKSQNNRERTLKGFRDGSIRVLVATDIAARGLDIDGVSHVVNYELPHVPESYVHRIGRTGRAGATGIAISLCDDEERSLLGDIERRTKKKIPHAALPGGKPAGRIKTRLEAKPRAEFLEPEQGDEPPRRSAARQRETLPARRTPASPRGKGPQRSSAHPRGTRQSRGPSNQRQNMARAPLPPPIDRGRYTPTSRKETETSEFGAGL
jgi:ATP-dependent RNA helicase RhlE